MSNRYENEVEETLTRRGGVTIRSTRRVRHQQRVLEAWRHREETERAATQEVRG